MQTKTIFGQAHRTAARLAVVAVLGVILSSCDLAPPPGDAPLRYRDQIFTEVIKTSGIAYGRAVDQQGKSLELQLDVYRPTGDGARRRPAVVWVHGGSFAFGNRTSPEIVDEATTLAKKGYVTASITYRLSPNGCRAPNAECIKAITDAREDAQAAVRFLRANATRYGIDPSRIAIGGTSAGAITALGVAYLSDEPGQSGTPGVSSEVRAAVSLSGAAIFNDAIDDSDAAALLFHGTTDGLVPYMWATDTVAAARAAGLRTELVTWPGEGHVPYARHRQQILDLTTNFLYRNLGLGLGNGGAGRWRPPVPA